MADLLHAYSRFVPDAVVQRHGRDPRPPSVAQADRFHGAVLMADIIGYTALTERYSRHPEGVEQLKTQLNDFFGCLNSVIFGYGGDIISFAGDSVFAVWRDRAAGENAAVRGAAQCALEAQRTLDRSDLGESLMLRMRIVVAAGDLAIATVGGHAGKWECVATGTPLSRIGDGVALAPPGSVVLDAAARECVGQDGAVTPLADGYVSLSRLLVPVSLPVGEQQPAPGAAAEALRAYIAPPVLKQLDAGQSDWLAEFRRVSTLFVRVAGIDYGAESNHAHLDAVTRAVQAAVARNEGTFHRVIVDDKGTNMLCVWGIPGCSHEDDAARALATALALPDELRVLNCRCGIGISSGRALCGPAGGGRRFEYTVVGDTVNLAARLMVAAGEGILCDVATGDATAGSFEFESPAPIEVKGRAGALPVLRPRARLRSAPAGATRLRAHTNFFGRRAELNRLRNCLEMRRDDEAALVTVEGEPGVGKSRLVAEFQRAIGAEGTTFLLGHADAIEHGTTYFIWREVLRQILNAAATRSVDAQRRYLETMFARERDLAAWLPLINDVLPLGFAETPALHDMSEQGRAESTLNVLLHILHCAIDARPVVLVLEDAHWMDSISWTLAARLMQREPSLMLVLVMRSGHTPDSADGRELLARTAAQRISLASFSREDTATLVCDRLRVSRVPDELVSLIFGRTDGHPLFSEELAYALRDSGYLLMRNGECLLAGEAARSDAQKMPETVEGIIASRIDRLAADEQLTLKIASVLGRSFTRGALCAVHPLQNDETVVARHLGRFVELDLLYPLEAGGAGDFQFKHIITQEVTYGLLSFAQRRDLHRAAGGWLERTHAGALNEVYPLLAHHWSRAGDAARGFDYLHKAGEQAFRRYANREAADFLEEARAVKFAPEALPPLEERASCERLLGFSWLWLGHIERSVPHIHHSLEMLGYRIPTSRLRLALGNSWQLLLAVRNHFLNRRFIAREATGPAARSEIVESLIRYTHIAWFRADAALNVHIALRILNMAERMQHSGETALIYSVLTSIAGAIPAHGLARRYRDLALEAAALAGDRGISSQVLLFVSLYQGGLGDWGGCIERVAQAEQFARDIGDVRRAEECMVISGYLHLHTGDIAGSAQFYESAAQSARRRGDRQTTSWGLLGVARVNLVRGRPELALAALAEAAPSVTDSLGGIELHGLNALAHLRNLQYEQAWQAARAGMQLLRDTRPVSFTTLTGTAGVTESLIALWAHARGGVAVDRPDVLKREARRALGRLGQFARIFPMGCARWQLQRGHFALAAGRTAEALECWQKSAAAAELLSMPWDEALAWLEISRHGAGSAATLAHARAEALLEKLALAEPAPAFPVSG